VENNRCTKKFQEASVTPLGPGTKPPPKDNLPRRKHLTKPGKTTLNKPRTGQKENRKCHTSIVVPRDKSHKGLAPFRPVTSTG
jgi:hypothetical protein